MKKYLLLLLAITLIGCSSDDENGEINIRLSNISDFTYEQVVVNTSTGKVGYENLGPGEVSDYKTFEVAYPYANVELYIDGDLFTLQPFDYVGEKPPLEHGNYTYEINAYELQDQLTLTLIRE